MADDLNPQAEQMADESMVRTLAAQAEAIWPQERPLIERYAVPRAARILDAGCGTGEISRRLAELLPGASILGVDVLDVSLELARTRHAFLAPRLSFERRSVYELGLPARTFDLVVCRHVLHSIPHPERVLAELVRVTRPGGRLHILAEDYGMIHFAPRGLDADELWDVAPRQFGRATGTDMHVGRRTHSLLRQLGMLEIVVDYVIVDTLRVPRATFAAIWQAWCDGFAEPIGERSSIPAARIRAHFADMIETIRDPDGYGVWFVPVISAVVP
jgi:SAM-dependent methyltransferase